MTYEEAYKEAKKLAIKEAKTKHNGNYVYIVFNIGRRDFDIARNWMEFMYKRMFGYRILAKISLSELREFCERKKEDINNDGQRNL